VPDPGAPYRLKLTPDAQAAHKQLEHSDVRKWKKVNKALQFLASDPRHNSLQAHKWETLKGKAPDGGDVWTAYVENGTPGAWRIFFFFDSREKSLIYVTSIEPHC
jgi:plasmid maintenance system killer protein